MLQPNNIRFQRFLPSYKIPIVDANGLCNRTWYIFFQDLNRSLGNDGQLNFNAASIQGQLTPAQLPADLVYKDAAGKIDIVCIPQIPATQITGVLVAAQLPTDLVYKGAGGKIDAVCIPQIPSTQITGSFTIAQQHADTVYKDPVTGLIDPACLPP